LIAKIQKRYIGRRFEGKEEEIKLTREMECGKR
jgi:hypothetical protein